MLVYFGIRVWFGFGSGFGPPFGPAEALSWGRARGSRLWVGIRLKNALEGVDGIGNGVGERDRERGGEVGRGFDFVD